MQSGTIDATEWVGPYNDLAFGLHTVAKHYYYPGWQEPGPTMECMINKTAFDALPDDLKKLAAACCQAINEALLAEYTVRNQEMTYNTACPFFLAQPLVARGLLLLLGPRREPTPAGRSSELVAGTSPRTDFRLEPLPSPGFTTRNRCTLQ